MPPGFKNEDLTADMIGSVLMEAIHQLVGEQHVILVGHSTGGFAALYIAATYPDSVSGVISISGFAHGKWNGTLGLLQHIARMAIVGRTIFKNNIKILTSSRLIYRIAAGFYAHDRKVLYSFPGFESILDKVYGDSKLLDADSLIPYFNRLPDIDIKERLQNITAPTLVLAGDEDPIIPSDQPHLIAKKILNSKKALVHGSGHLPMFERPEEYERAISDWIGENITH
jgi:pimeloyl-ACP methyl ester carboxylesterase